MSKTNQLPLHSKTLGAALPLYIKQSLQGANLCSSNFQCLLFGYLSLKVMKSQLWLTRLMSRLILQAHSGMNEDLASNNLSAKSSALLLALARLASTMALSLSLVWPKTVNL